MLHNAWVKCQSLKSLTFSLGGGIGRLLDGCSQWCTQGVFVLISHAQMFFP